MTLHYEQNCANCIDLLDEEGNVLAMVHGPNEGDEDITQEEIVFASQLCDAYNSMLGD